ncbi:MAG: FHA domain-containing protein [Desulfosudaceae bacterium]
MPKEIDDTLHLNPEDLDFLQTEKFQVDERLIYSGRKKGAFLVFVTGPDLGNAINLYQERLIIGRDKTCDIVINKPYASKKHAEILNYDDHSILQDYGSTNGTFVNDLPVNRIELKDRDEIKIGQVVLQYFRIDLNREEKPPSLPDAQPEKESEFYRQVFVLLKPHFGHMTTRFLNRQINAHTSKTPYTIASSDKQELAKWIEISVGLLLDDDTARGLAEKIRQLS